MSAAVTDNAGYDQRPYDPKAVKMITQQWVDSNMKEREAQFTESISAKIFCGTWNVNAKKQEGGLTDWLLPKEVIRAYGPADVYVVGFQEMVDLNAMNVALDGGKSQQRSQFWQQAISECLQTIGQYNLVAEKHLVGLLLVVYVKSSLQQHVRDVRTSSLGVGIMGMLGNKGGVSVRMCLYDTPLCFVCAHLAAHRENVAGRNSDFKSIYERTVFTVAEPTVADARDDENSLVVRPRYGAARYIDTDVIIPDHEIIYWIGDLNYRITEDVSTEDVFYKIDTKEIAYLRQYDQLNIERARGAVFQGFSEGELNFNPTYKFQPGTDLYERRAEKKLRAPAWCDRVLWKPTNANSVRLLDYRASTLRPSDHKPVSALLDTDLKIVVAQKEKEVYSELMNRLEYWTSDREFPCAEVIGYPIDLVSVKYNFKKSSLVQIKNKGKTYLHWHFIHKLDENKFCKNWISISCKSGLLFPDEVKDIEISVLVDKETAQAINQGRESLTDILVLRIENYSDFYINVTCAFDRSCYGMHLQELVTLAEPVRQTSLPGTQTLIGAPERASSNGSISSSSNSDSAGSAAGAALAVPKELWRLVDALWTSRALQEKDLFDFELVAEIAQSSNRLQSDEARFDTVEMLRIREALDCNVPFEGPVTPHDLAKALVELASSFALPVIPSELIPLTDIESPAIKQFVRRLLDTLATVNYNLLVYLLSFYREVLKQGDYNRVTASKMVDICIFSFMKSSTAINLTDSERSNCLQREQVMRPVFLYLLTTDTL